MTIVRNSSKEQTPSTVKGSSTSFTGDVYLDGVLSQDNTVIGNVTFTPCARTFWHHHAGGQILKVLAGAGWVCDQGGEPQRIKVGDTVWCPPGTVHWHGADAGSYMTHTAISLGKTEFREEVSAEDFAKAKLA